jgi:hypothetical protein
LGQDQTDVAAWHASMMQAAEQRAVGLVQQLQEAEGQAQQLRTQLGTAAAQHHQVC